MNLLPILHLPPHLAVTQITLEPERLLLLVEAQAPQAACPVCGCLSTRIHSVYFRTLADLPCSGRQVVLRLQVRKWRCDQSECPRRIFTERLPSLALTSARMTVRLTTALQAIGLATSGEGGTRLAHRLGITTSPTTVLRRIMDVPDPPAPPVIELGLDDWSYRRGKRFGAILVDLGRHRVVDLLPDRSAETAETWLRHHPAVRLVSRDRAREFARAIAQGAPQATQVVDRFHLTVNLAQALDPVVIRRRKAIRAVLAAAAPVVSPPVPEPGEWRPGQNAARERASQVRQAQREEQYEQVVALAKLGLSRQAIATRLGVGKRRVERWLAEGKATAGSQHKRSSTFDPYAAYVLTRWEAGTHNGIHLWQEIKALGYRGSQRMVYRFLQPLRQGWLPPMPSLPAGADLTATQIRWLFLRTPSTLTAREAEQVQWLCAQDQTLALAYTLVQEFLRLVHERAGQDLPTWVRQCEASGIEELMAFARGLSDDWEAVQAGLTLPASNAQTEGFVNKLKLLKRMMYGRAGFPLLRQRLLHGA